MKKKDLLKKQWPLFFIAAFGILCFLDFQQLTATVLNLSSFWVDVSLRGIYTGMILYMAWFNIPHFSWNCRVVMTAFCGVVWAGYWGIGERTALLMELVGIGILLVDGLILFRRKIVKGQGEGLEVVSLGCLSLYGMKQMTIMDQYTYVEGDLFGLVFFGAIFLSALLAVVVALWTFWERRREKKPFLQIIGCFWFVLVLFFLPAGGHLNYVLDFSEPVLMEGTVVGHNSYIHRRGPDSYELSLTLNGKEYELEVSREDYYSYQVGDSYEVYRCKGAFGRAFYTAVRD